MWQWYIEMFTVNWETQAQEGWTFKKKEGTLKKELMFTQNSVKHKDIVKFYMNKWGRFIRLCLYILADGCLPCMISPKECSYYASWQSLLTCLAYVQHLFKQPTYATKHPHPHKTPTQKGACDHWVGSTYPINADNPYTPIYGATKLSSVTLLKDLTFSIECFPYNRPSCGWNDPQQEQKLDLFWRICFCSSTFCYSVHLSTCTV